MLSVKSLHIVIKQPLTGFNVHLSFNVQTKEVLFSQLCVSSLRWNVHRISLRSCSHYHHGSLWEPITFFLSIETSFDSPLIATSCTTFDHGPSPASEGNDIPKLNNRTFIYMFFPYQETIFANHLWMFFLTFFLTFFLKITVESKLGNQRSNFT